jgi:hypothetical protein
LYFKKMKMNTFVENVLRYRKLAVTHVCPKQAFPEQTCGFGLAP